MRRAACSPACYTLCLYICIALCIPVWCIVCISGRTNQWQPSGGSVRTGSCVRWGVRFGGCGGHMCCTRWARRLVSMCRRTRLRGQSVGGLLLDRDRGVKRPARRPASCVHLRGQEDYVPGVCRCG